MPLFNSGNIPNFNIEHAINNNPPPIDIVFGGLLAGTVGGLIGAGGTSKSFFALEKAIAIACGHDITCTDPHIKKGKVTYFNAEDSPGILHYRVNAISKHLNADQQADVVQNLNICPLVGQFPWIIDDKGVAQQPVIDFISQNTVGHRLIILDTLRRFHVADENDSGKMSVLLDNLEAVAKNTGSAILFLHHTSKASKANGSGSESSSSRGSTVLVDNARYIVSLVKGGERNGVKLSMSVPANKEHHYLKLHDSKCNNAPPKDEDPILFRCPGGVLVQATQREFETDSGRNREVNNANSRSNRSATRGGRIARSDIEENEQEQSFSF